MVEILKVVGQVAASRITGLSRLRNDVEAIAHRGHCESLVERVQNGATGVVLSPDKCCRKGKRVRRAERVRSEDTARCVLDPVDDADLMRGLQEIHQEILGRHRRVFLQLSFTNTRRRRHRAQLKS